MNAFLYLITIVGTLFCYSFSMQNELYGEDLFLTIFGLDSTSSCELCDDWLQPDVSERDVSIPEKVSAVIADKLSNLSDQSEEYVWFLQDQNCCLYLATFFVLFLLLFSLCKCRGQVKSSGTSGHQDVGIKDNMQTTRKSSLEWTAVRDLVLTRPACTRDIPSRDKLRKTKKQRPQISRQGLTILKPMKRLLTDVVGFDNIPLKSCKIVSVAHKLSSDKMQVFDLKNRHAIPSNVIDTLLCIEPNCTQHPHQEIKKCGCKIVCDSKIFARNSINGNSEKQMIIYKDIDDEIVDNYVSVVHAGELDNKQDRCFVLDNVSKYEELGPPRASSSFINSSSSMTITCDHDCSYLSDNAFDPFSYLDETPLQARTSFLWFGSLYNSTLETSFASFRLEDLNKSLSQGLEQLENSLDITEIQKNQSLYGFNTESIFQIAAVYFAKHLIATIKKVFAAKKPTTESKDLLSEDMDDRKELDATGFAVYDSRYFE